MKRAWCRSLFVVALAALCSAPARTQSDLAATIAALVAATPVARDLWGVKVVAMDGTPLVSLNEGQLFQPASNTKLFTTAAALALLASDNVFETQVLAASAPVSGMLHGDLVLKGGGDAYLSNRLVPYAAAKKASAAIPPPPPLNALDALADAIAATGLKRIEGDIVGDDTLFPWEPYGPDWAADDLLWGYGAPVSALSINDNQLSLTIRPGILSGIVAPDGASLHADSPVPPMISIDPATPFYSIQNDAITTERNSRTSIGLDRAAGSRVVRVFGTIATNAPAEVEEVAIEDPAEYAASSLKLRLEQRGIVITGSAIARHRLPVITAGFLEQTHEPVTGLSSALPSSTQPCPRCKDDRPPLVVHRSATVAEDVIATNKDSLNLHAELLLHQLGLAFGKEGSIAQGARVVRSFAISAGVDKDDFVLYDGSGMSGHNLVTPRALAKLLQFASTQPWFVEYKLSLPTGGVDGSLQHRFNLAPLKGHVFAKTGTNSESRALSGYLECASGRTVIFSILVGNHAPGSTADRDVMDRIVAAIAAAE